MAQTASAGKLNVTNWKVMTKFFLKAIVLAVLVAVAAGSGRAAGVELYCEGNRRAHFPSLTGFWNNVGERLQLTVSDEAREAIWGEFCEASVSFVSDGSVTYGAINEAASTILIAYLERTLDPELGGRSMAATLRTAFGVPGLSRPKRKRYGLVKLKTGIALDKVSIGDRTYEPRSRYLVHVGVFRFAGLKDSHEICVEEIEITPEATSVFSCMP